MSFHDDLKAFAKKTNQRIDTVVKKTCFDLSKSIVYKTPVDTGMARNNWMPAINIPDATVGHKDNPMGNIDRVSRSAYENVYFLTNSLPYIGMLEFGYSKQAPKGMVRITVAEFKATVRKVVSGVT